MKNAPRVKFLVMAAASSSVRFRARLLGRNCGGAVVVAAAVGVGVVLVAGGGGGEEGRKAGCSRSNSADPTNALEERSSFEVVQMVLGLCDKCVRRA